MWGKMKIEIKEVLKGIAFFIYSWIIFTLVAFVVFEPTSKDTAIILLVTIIIISFSYIILKKDGLATSTFNFTILIIVIILTILYLVPVNDNIPDEAIQFNNQISENNLDRIEYAEELFFEVEKKWDSPIREYLRQPQKSFFIKDFETFWNIQGYAPSNIQAQMYRLLLLESGRFTEEEVIFENSLCTNSPHGIVIIFPNEERIFADLWSVDQFEEYEFGLFSPYPCDELRGKLLE